MNRTTPRWALTALLTASAMAWSAPAAAQEKLTVWWIKSFYQAEDTALRAMIRKFEYLNYSLAFILAFVGVKMIIEKLDVPIHILVSLGVIVGSITIGIVTSLRAAKKDAAEAKR